MATVQQPVCYQSKCVCRYGFIWLEPIQLCSPLLCPVDLVCKVLPNSRCLDGSCVCIDGYKINEESQLCVEDKLSTAAIIGIAIAGVAVVIVIAVVVMMKQDDKDNVKALAKSVAEKVDQLAKCVDNVSISSLSKMLDQKLANISSPQTMNSTPPPVTYAAAIRLPVKTVIEKKIEENTMIIKATSPAQVQEVQNLVLDGVKKMRNGKEKQIKINTIIRTRTGAVVKVPKEENLDDLISHFKAIDKLKGNSTIYKRKDLQPTGVLKGVNHHINFVRTVQRHSSHPRIVLW
ncbi:hypothetical protein TYRP_023400 [Tyrophagus putrescentiae]|nr:hypothetical protein TYRP_023400 [Tyrophagus putrescentiae]